MINQSYTKNTIIGSEDIFIHNQTKKLHGIPFLKGFIALPGSPTLVTRFITQELPYRKIHGVNLQSHKSGETGESPAKTYSLDRSNTKVLANLQNAPVYHQLLKLECTFNEEIRIG